MSSPQGPRRIPTQALLVVGAILALVLGVIGWFRFHPGITPWEALYRTLLMFGLTWDIPYDEPNIPLTLELARFLALSVAGGAIIAVIWRVLSEQRDLETARRAKGHAVIFGTGPEVVGLVRNLREQQLNLSRIVVVGDFSEDDRAALTDQRATILQALGESQLHKVLADSEVVIVSGQTDDESALLAGRVASKLEHSPRLTVALFNEPAITRHWNRQRSLPAMSRNEQAAIALLRRTPPVLEDAVCPPPIVVGDGPMGREVARRMVIGWQQLGELMTVHCFGTNEAWVDAARVGLQNRGNLVFTPISHSPELIAYRARLMVDSWDPPRPDRFASTGPTIVIALDDDAIGVSTGVRIVESLPTSRVTVLVRDPSTWTGCVGSSHGALRLVSAAELLADPRTHALSKEALLAEELLSDTLRWPDEVPSVFGDLPQDAADGDPNTSANHAIEAVASNAVDILKAGNITLATADLDDVEPILSDPEELAAMRDLILSVIGDRLDGSDDSQEQSQRALELAARLPTLAARAGWTPRRSPGTTNMLSTEEVAELAKMNHFHYLQISEETDNATHSENAQREWEKLDVFNQESNRAQAVDIPAKLAAVGLSWRRSHNPVTYEFDADTVCYLGELEHRRWEHHQRRNGRSGHEWAKPWDELEENVKEYDFNAVRVIPGAIAEFGVEIVRPE